MTKRLAVPIYLAALALAPELTGQTAPYSYYYADTLSNIGSNWAQNGA